MPFLSYTQNFNNNLLMLLARDAERYRPIVDFFDTSTRRLAELSWAEAELVAAEISKNNRSEFCSGIRAGMARALAADADRLRDDRLTLVLAFALKVNRDASSVTQTDVDTLLNAGWSEQTVEDIVGLVAIQRLYNTLAAGLGFDALPAAVFDAIGQDTVNKGGYSESFRTFVENATP